MEKAKLLLEQIISAIVSDTEKVSVEVTKDEMGVLFTLHVAAEDMGMVIGKEGNMAVSIRNILRAVGQKEKARINLKIAEPEGSTRVNRPYRNDRNNPLSKRPEDDERNY